MISKHRTGDGIHPGILNSYIAVNEKLSYYRIHQENTCGITELKNKRKLIDKIKTFDDAGKKHIVHQYMWYKDTFSYAKEVKIPEIIQLYNFFAKNRISILQERTWKSLGLLLKKYFEGVYKAEGKIVFIHDIYYVVRYFMKKRRDFIGNLNNCYERYK